MKKKKKKAKLFLDLCSLLAGEQLTGITTCESLVEFHLVLVFLSPFRNFNGKFCCDDFSSELVITSGTNQVSDIVVSTYRIAEYTRKNHGCKDGEKEEIQEVESQASDARDWLGIFLKLNTR